MGSAVKNSNLLLRVKAVLTSSGWCVVDCEGSTRYGTIENLMAYITHWGMTVSCWQQLLSDGTLVPCNEPWVPRLFQVE